MHSSGRILAFLAFALPTLACNFATDLANQLIEQLNQSAATNESAPGESPSTPGSPRLLPTEVGPAATFGPDPGESIPLEIREQMDQIQEEVVLLRGLQPTGPVARALLSPEALRQYVTDDFLADYTEEEARDDARTLALLGLMEPDYDLFNLYLELYSEQIAGFYDDELKQMFVVQGAGFHGPERITHAHEYTHALQDQHYDLRNGLGFNDEACELDSERCAAIQALVEGDASLLEERWLLTYATDQDYQDLLDFYDSLESPVFDSAPQFLQDDFIFPYQSGRAFVEHFFLDGGFAAVDAVYADPPSSTEQILHPERYPSDRPVKLEPAELLASLGSGWREIDRDVVGEWYTQLTLREQVLPEQAAPAAEGWGGDYFLTFYHDEQNQGALVLLTVWDSVRDAHEFFGVFLEYGDTRFGGRSLSTTAQAAWDSSLGHASIELLGDQTLWILAPDAQLAQTLRQGMAFPAARSQ
jgi:hypothetical protein